MDTPIRKDVRGEPRLEQAGRVECAHPPFSCIAHIRNVRYRWAIDIDCQATYLTKGRKLKEDLSWPWDVPVNSMSTRPSTSRFRCSGAKATKARRWPT